MTKLVGQGKVVPREKHIALSIIILKKGKFKAGKWNFQVANKRITE